MQPLAVAVRAAQYGALLPLLGLAAFAVYAPQAAALLERRRVNLALALIGLASGAASLLLLAAAMSGEPAGALDPQTVAGVISDTDAGRAWLVRMIVLVVAAVLVGRASPLPLLAAAALAIATLAWGGHGAADEGAFGLIHLAADILHLLAAGIWIGALVAFVRLVRLKSRVEATASALAAFSGVGAASVATLVATGLVNAARLVDWRPWPVLTTSLWGWLMLAKLALFAVMLALAAANRFWLTPRLAAGADAHAIRLSLASETALAIAIVVLVSALGTLAPPAAG